MTKKTEKFLPSVSYTKLPTSGQDTLPLVFQEIKKATNIAINKSIKHTTMEATNISIKQQSSVLINVDALQEIKQRVLLSIKQLCNVGAWSLPRLYRKELRMARAAVRTIDAHPTLSNIFLCLMGIAIMVEVFLFA